MVALKIAVPGSLQRAGHKQHDQKHQGDTVHDGLSSRLTHRGFGQFVHQRQRGDERRGKEEQAEPDISDQTVSGGAGQLRQHPHADRQLEQRWNQGDPASPSGKTSRVDFRHAATGHPHRTGHDGHATDCKRRQPEMQRLRDDFAVSQVAAEGSRIDHVAVIIAADRDF